MKVKVDFIRYSWVYSSFKLHQSSLLLQLSLTPSIYRQAASPSLTYVNKKRVVQKVRKIRKLHALSVFAFAEGGTDTRAEDQTGLRVVLKRCILHPVTFCSSTSQPKSARLISSMCCLYHDKPVKASMLIMASRRVATFCGAVCESRCCWSCSSQLCWK